MQLQELSMEVSISTVTDGIARLDLGICKHVTLLGKRKNEVAEGMKFTNQLRFKQRLC